MPSNASRDERDRVVVTGRGLVTSVGIGVEASFDAMARGTSGAGVVTRFDTEGLPCHVACQVDDGALLPPHPLDERASTGLRLFRTALAEALPDGLPASVPPPSVAVVLGCHGYVPDVGLGLVLTRHTAADGTVDLEGLTADPDYTDAELYRRLPDALPAGVARLLGAQGLSIAVVSACAAGTQAIGEATRMLRDGRAEVVVTGGVEPLLTYAYYVGFALLGAMAKRQDPPEKASRPFDRRRSGFVIAEGAGALVLETLEGARSRGREVLGEILGYGDSADAYRITDVHPKGDGAVAAMERAIADAGLGPDDVEYVNAHGTSTPTNDPSETLAIKRVLGERAGTVPVSSNKSMIGHTIGAAGAVEAVLTFEGMRRGVLLPTINLETPDRRCDLDYVPNAAREKAHRVALSNSFGFGGQNGCLCLGAPR